MFDHIMVPIDLHMPPEVGKAMNVAAELAQWQGAKLSLVSVTGPTVGDAPHTLETIQEALAKIAGQLTEQGIDKIETFNITSNDVAVEVDGDLTRAAEQIGADLIVVGTHAPRLTDYILSSHAGYLAKHASMSVLVVR